MWLKRVAASERVGNFSAAEAALRDALRDDPHAADLRFALAYALLRENRPREALAEYTAASADRNPTPEEIGQVGQAYILLGDTADADHWTARALREQPRDAVLWYSLGRIRYTEQRFNESAACFRHVLALSPRNAKAENNLGLTEEGLNHIDAAIAAYRQSIAWFDAADAVNTGATSTATPGTPSGAAASPRTPPAIARGSDQPRLNLAILLLHQGELAEAESLLRQALLLDPDDSHIHEQLGQLAVRQGDANAAVAAFAEAVRLNPGQRGLHFLLGQALRRAGRSAEAQVQFDEAARLATQSAGASVAP